MADTSRNQNAAEWMEAGRRYGIGLDFLHQDKKEIHENVRKLGLPCPQVYNFADLDSPMIRAYFRGSDFFCRLIPHHEGLRPFREKLTSYEELKKFCSKFPREKYIIQLVEKGDVTHTGGIIAQDGAQCKRGVPGQCVIELVQGDGPDLFHGCKTPVHAEVDFHGCLRFNPNTDGGDFEKSLMLSALRMVGGPGHPFPGYYEFEVWKERNDYPRKHLHNTIMFRNHQPQESAYARLQ